MVMSKKEYEKMEFYRQSAVKYEQKFNKLNNKLNELKIYLKLSIKIDNNKEYEKILTFLEKVID